MYIRFITTGIIHNRKYNGNQQNEFGKGIDFEFTHIKETIMFNMVCKGKLINKALYTTLMVVISLQLVSILYFVMAVIYIGDIPCMVFLT